MSRKKKKKNQTSALIVKLESVIRELQRKLSVIEAKTKSPPIIVPDKNVTTWPTSDPVVGLDDRCPM